jgi:hypothetical protein
LLNAVLLNRESLLSLLKGFRAQLFNVFSLRETPNGRSLFRRRFMHERFIDIPKTHRTGFTWFQSIRQMVGDVSIRHAFLL